MDLKPSTSIGGGALRRGFYAHFAGREADDQGLAGRIAWALEQDMLSLGWPVGENLGPERALIQRLGVARDTFREAVRILERRGSACMTRGRFGGLVVQRPREVETATALAVYLRAIDGQASDAFSAETAAAAHAGLRPLIPLFHDVGGALSTLSGGRASSLGAGSANPAAAAAALSDLLLEDVSTLGPGERAGSEWELGARLSGSPKVFRQALRLLDDFDVLETRRGRGNGVFVRRPTPAGVVRLMFPYLASRFDLEDLLGQVWRLTAVQLRLAGERLRDAGPSARKRAAASLESRVGPLDSPWRWATVQEGLGEIARNPLVDTMIRSLVTYVLRRLEKLDPLPPEALSPLLDDERIILGALSSQDSRAAEEALSVGGPGRDTMLAELLLVG